MRFREIRETREVREVRKAEKSAFENLQESSELLHDHGVFRPNPDTKPGGEMWNKAKSALGITEPDEELKGLEYAQIAKKILDLKKAERDANGSLLFGLGKKSMREVEKDLSNEGMLKSETQSQVQQQSYKDKYKAAMDAAQELASSGFYSMEDAIRIVMANL